MSPRIEQQTMGVVLIYKPCKNVQQPKNNHNVSNVLISKLSQQLKGFQFKMFFHHRNIIGIAASNLASNAGQE